ncbi:MAG: HD domain-containing protein [Chloroflexota bacterium]
MNKTSNRIKEIEKFAKESMASIKNLDLKLAHDYKHVDRVRGWILQIAQNEGYNNLEQVEATALLHDIGLAHVEHRRDHAKVGAQLAAQFLQEHALFSNQEIREIEEAIRYHSATSGGGTLGKILRDADKMELFGAIGIMRCITHSYSLQDYDAQQIKGETWQLPIEGFEKRFADGLGVGPSIIDHLNFQISLYSDLYTKAAQELALPQLAYTKNFIKQLESEVNTAQSY